LLYRIIKRSTRNTSFFINKERKKKMLKDYEIAHQNKPEKITKIASKINLSENDIECFGEIKAKIKNPIQTDQKGKLILVTAMNPTPYGEGKTTVAIGLHDALRDLGYSSLLTLREPSLGPVFGVKGGATGGGYAQVVPMEDINLHFNGDFHAITTANNLISTMIDNTIYHGNSLDLDLENIYFTRTLDLNDRVLRDVTLKIGNYQRKEHFTITAACEIMSTVCLAKDLEDLRSRLNKIIIGKNNHQEYVYVKDLNITGSLLALLKDAIKPNIVQTLEHNPVLIHGGPFANIAPGCNSVIALKHALATSEYVLTEAGFGFDLGGFKFIDIICRTNQLKLDGIVFVVTLRALKHHGLSTSNPLEQLKKGISNLDAHLENLNKMNISYIITLNKYDDDTEEEIEYLKNYLANQNISLIINTVYQHGGKGALELASKVIELKDQPISYLYNIKDPLQIKIEKVCKTLLHAKEINYSSIALQKIKEAEKLFNDLPICIAKTQYSISDKKEMLGNPRDYDIMVKDIRIYNGAGFITIYLGNILTMPGLNQNPAATSIDVIENQIINIF